MQILNPIEFEPFTDLHKTLQVDNVGRRGLQMCKVGSIRPLGGAQHLRKIERFWNFL
jgi:hypothetical protein